MTFSFDILISFQILIYLRMCLLWDIDVPLKREILRHPCEFSPVITARLQSKINQGNTKKHKNPLVQYILLIRELLIANPSKFVSMCLSFFY